MVTPCMGTALGGFQTQVTRRLTGQFLQRKTDGTWKYTSAAAREAAGLLTMEEHVRRHQNMVAQYIATESLLDLCEGRRGIMGRELGCCGRNGWELM